MGPIRANPSGLKSVPISMPTSTSCSRVRPSRSSVLSESIISGSTSTYELRLGSLRLPLVAKLRTSRAAPNSTESKSWLADAYASPVTVMCAAAASPSDGASTNGMPSRPSSRFASPTIPSVIEVVCWAYFLAASESPASSARSYFTVASFLIARRRAISAAFIEGGVPSNTYTGRMPSDR